MTDSSSAEGERILKELQATNRRLLRRYLAPASTATYRPAVPALGAFDAEAAFVNVTAVDHRLAGYVTTFDCVTRRLTSTVNPIVGEVNANGASVPLRIGLDSCAYTMAGGNLVVDLNGWWVR